MFYQRRLCVLLLLIITLFSLPFSLFINPYLTIFFGLAEGDYFYYSEHVWTRSDAETAPVGVFAAVDLSYA